MIWENAVAAILGIAVGAGLWAFASIFWRSR